MKKREQYNYFYVDAFTYQTMHDEALKEMNRVKNKKNDKQRTIVQVSIPKRLFRLLKYYGFKVQSIDWGHTDKNYKDVILDSYDFIVSSPLSAGLDNHCENVLIDKRLEETVSKYIENSPKDKIRSEISQHIENGISVYLSLPTLLAYKLKTSSLMSGVYMSDIITHILGYLMPKLIVQKYRKYIENKRYIEYEEFEPGEYTPFGTNYIVINRMLAEVLRFSNNKVRYSLDFSKLDVTNDEFFEKFEYCINSAITDY